MSVPSSSSMLPAKPPVSDSEKVHSPIASQIHKDEDLNSQSESEIPKPKVADDNNRPAELSSDQPPLPAEEPPPLPNEEPPTNTEDDGWQPIWDESAQAFYFYNHLTQQSQWENPRIPESSPALARVADTGPPGAIGHKPPRKAAAGGYDPAIHGDYDANADYAKVHEPEAQKTFDGQPLAVDPSAAYAATGAFNRFTGRWQSAEMTADKFSDENKSARQMNAFFDVDASANSHDGRSLKAERSGKKVTKAELKAFREKRKEKKEEKRRAWLRD